MGYQINCCDQNPIASEIVIIPGEPVCTKLFNSSVDKPQVNNKPQDNLLDHFVFYTLEI